MPMAVPAAQAVLVAVLLAAVQLSSAARTPDTLQHIGQATNSVSMHKPKWWRRHHDSTECDDPEFRKTSLRLIKEAPIIGLFANNYKNRKFEASGMTQARGKLWMVFDNLLQLGRIDERFSFRGEENVLIGEEGEDSQFEGLSYVKSTGHFLALQESHDSEEHGLVPLTLELELAKDESSYRVIRKCPVHYELTHENKGFESMHYHEDEHGHKYMLGLCEGNYCTGGKEGREPGNGRIIVSEFYEKDDKCGWDVTKEIPLPREAYFADYSGMAFKGSKVAIISQEAAAVYVTHFDFEKQEFVTSEDDRVYTMPRNAACEVLYCNIEGVQWLDDDRLVIASDKAKADQPYPCTLKDQSVHIVGLPS